MITEPQEEYVLMLHDLNRALREAPLTIKERELITLRYFQEPIAPARDKKDKNGGASGRPAGGLTDEAIASLLFEGTLWSKKGKFKRMKQSALKKIQQTLGEGY